jgi:hypothetical protein
MNEQFSDELKQAIKEGFVLINEPHGVAVVGANVSKIPETAEGILLLIRKSLGLRAELQSRHGYTVL